MRVRVRLHAPFVRSLRLRKQTHCGAGKEEEFSLCCFLSQLWTKLDQSELRVLFVFAGAACFVPPAGCARDLSWGGRAHIRSNCVCGVRGLDKRGRQNVFNGADSPLCRYTNCPGLNYRVGAGDANAMFWQLELSQNTLPLAFSKFYRCLF